jgi:hypothetical protein
MSGPMSSVGDLNSLIGGALKQTPPVQQPVATQSAPASPEDGQASMKKAIEMGGMPPIPSSQRTKLTEEIAIEKNKELRNEQIAPSQKDIRTATSSILNLWGMSEDDAKIESEKYNQLLPNFDRKVMEARKLYEQKEEELGTEQAKVAMFKILGHLAMGLYGAKYGVDTSGLVFDTTDWAARHNKLMNQYKMDVDLAEGDYRRGESRMSRIEGLYKWASARGEEYAKEQARVKEGAARVSNIKTREEVERMQKREDELRQEERFNVKEAAKERTAEQKAAAKETAAAAKAEADKQKRVDTLAMKLAGAKTSALRQEAASQLGEELGGLSFAAWQEDPKAQKSWLSEDLTDYMDYVKKLKESKAMPAAPAPLTQQAKPSNMVRVKSPSGQVGEIPAEKLQKALDSGYTKI